MFTDHALDVWFEQDSSGHNTDFFYWDQGCSENSVLGLCFEALSCHVTPMLFYFQPQSGGDIL